MGRNERPSGVIVLSFGAFLISGALLWSGARAVQSLPSGGGIRGSVAILCLILSKAGLFILSWSSFVVARDLWHLKPRGRYLTVAAMILLFAYGLGVSFLSGVISPGPGRDLLTAVGRIISACSSLVVLYLFLPSVSSRFRQNVLPRFP